MFMNWRVRSNGMGQQSNLQAAARPGRLRVLCAYAGLFFPTLVLAAGPSPTPPLNVTAPSSVELKTAPALNPAAQLSLSIEEVTVVDHGTSMSWYAKTITRANRIAKDQLEIQGYQMLGKRVLGNAGAAMTSGTELSKGDRRTFARQNWTRIRDAAQLKVVIKDKRTGQSTFKIVGLPQPGGQAATQAGGAAAQLGDMASGQFTDPEQKIVVEEATYRGRGAYRVRLKNVGNRGVGAQQLILRPIYYVKNRPAVIGEIATNLSAILANGSNVVSSDGGGIYTFGMAECSLLDRVVLEIRNPLTGQLLEHPIHIPNPKGEILDVDLYLSNLGYTVKNTGSYKSKFKVRMLNMTVYKGKYDKIATIHDLLHTSVTLEPGETKTVSINSDRVNAELKAKLPSLKKSFYGADNYMVELYTEYESDYCGSQPFAVDQASLQRHGGTGAGEEILISD